MPDAPGPAPDRAAAEQRLRIAKGTLRALTSYRGAPDFREDVEIVLAELDRQHAVVGAIRAAAEVHPEAPESELTETVRLAVRDIASLNRRLDLRFQEAERLRAELDRQRALIAAVLAECDAREQWAQPWQTAGLSCTEIRALLEGERR